MSTCSAALKFPSEHSKFCYKVHSRSRNRASRSLAKSFGALRKEPA
ncbi:hypothetical protein JMJ77_0002704 [Colletotrichum scovillei]|uniref:Uncharacterized protein n=1 Tax=Colletotrichum scovillei TaxID=1209932 RepID=A0A9P7R8I8_9PEZI|nr:hypothetical protein JMJ77_0002704 [Colletotrichum scovillei]KAG7071129.1 hypothetical protein JMJ76_0002366 [Colletotrichum scovillei]KAG7079335.1 hypothetical protein JMJ78_0002989 [Colletotrichum scovillei]